jgi:hypothetical protein
MLVNNNDVSINIIEGYYRDAYEEYVKLKNDYPNYKFTVYCGLIPTALMWIMCLLNLRNNKTIKQINESNHRSFSFARIDNYGDNLSKQWLIKPIKKHDVKVNTVFKYEIDNYTSTVYFTTMDTTKLRSFQFLDS